MSFDTIRPIISGLIGATIACWLASRWAKRVPLAKDPGAQKRLLKSQKNVIRGANVGAGIGIAVGLGLYFGGFLADNDWRGLGLCFGLVALLPLLVIVLANAKDGTAGISRGLDAYAIAQKTPRTLLYALMGLMIGAGAWATIELISAKTTNAEQGAGGQPAARSESK